MAVFELFFSLMDEKKKDESGHEYRNDNHLFSHTKRTTRQPDVSLHTVGIPFSSKIIEKIYIYIFCLLFKTIKEVCRCYIVRYKRLVYYKKELR